MSPIRVKAFSEKICIYAYMCLNGLVEHDMNVIREQEQHRLQNSPYFCVFKYERAVKQKCWNEAENGE